MSERPRLRSPLGNGSAEEIKIARPTLQNPHVAIAPAVHKGSMPLELTQLGVVIYVLNPLIEGRYRISYGGGHPLSPKGEVDAALGFARLERMSRLRAQMYNDLAALVDACYAACGIKQNVVAEQASRPSLKNISLSRSKGDLATNAAPASTRPRLRLNASPDGRKIVRGRT